LEIGWGIFAAYAGELVWSTMLWGGYSGALGLCVGIGLCVALSKGGALGVTFRGAGVARGVVYFLVASAATVGAGAMGAAQGAVRGALEIVRSPAFTSEVLRPAALPLTVGVVHAVAVQTRTDVAAMLAGTAPVPVAPLRAILTEPTGTAFVAGLRRVPELDGAVDNPIVAGLASTLGEELAGEHAAGVLEAAGIRAGMDALAAALPTAPTMPVGQLRQGIEAQFLPAFTGVWLGKVGGQVRMAVLVPTLATIAIPVGLLWAIEGLVRLVRGPASKNRAGPGSAV